MSIRNLDKIFKPRSIALIGASSRSGSVGAVTLRNLLRANFAGPLYLVNSRRQTLQGMPVYADVGALPSTPDLAVIATPPETVPGLISELGARGTKGAVVISAGFGELGELGQELQHQALESARPHLLRLVGPNCVGVMVPGSGLDASFSHLAPLPGNLAFISQSGALITAVLDWARPRGIGFSHVVSLGDMADIDFGDTIDYLATDPGTRAILLYVEGITHARKFMSAARAAARIKPVVVVKVGRFAETALAVRSHTGALAGSDLVYEAAFRRAGMLRVDTMAELFGAVETLALTHSQHGDRLAILTNGGGPGVLATDALIGMGGKLAALSPTTMEKFDKLLPATWSRGNPVDIIGDASGQRYASALAVLLDDANLDAVLVLNCPTALAAPIEAAQAVVETLDKRGSADAAPRPNVFTAWLGEQSAAPARQILSQARIATYDMPDDAVLGFMHRARYRRNQELLMETPVGPPDGFEPDRATVEAVVSRAIAGGQRWLDAGEVASVLTAYGVPVVKSRFASDAEAAMLAADEIAGTVALKIRSPDITHKSDVGGVALYLANPELVRAEAIAMIARVKAARPEARIDGFLVQEMVQRPGALELIVGLVDDRVFGPIVMFGQGGTAVELLNDTSLELPPLNMSLARAQMARTRVWRLLQGYRGKPPADIDAVARTLVRIGLLAAAHAEIVELDINPLLADSDGVIVVDARIAVADVPLSRHGRQCIPSYPRAFESSAQLPDGSAIRLRPIRPEDEPLLQDIFAHMAPADIRRRFLTPLRQLPHTLAARLSQIDYDREMALIAQPGESDAGLGVARYAADPDNRRAEFAVSVRSDWSGRGLGLLLLTRLLDVARRRGVGEIFGDIERDDKAMLTICQALEFTISANSDDRCLVRASKSLVGVASEIENRDAPSSRDAETLRQFARNTP